MAQKKASTEKEEEEEEVVQCVCALVIKSVRQNPSFSVVVEVVVEVVVVDSGYY